MKSKDSQLTNEDKTDSETDNKPKKTNKPKKISESKFKDDKETLHFLLGKKLAYLNTVAIVCMSWWVSSIVFCGTILAAVWIRRIELVNSGIIEYLGYAVGIFFVSFICFGLAAICYLCKCKKKISELIENLQPKDSKQIPNDAFPIPNDAFNNEIHSIMCGITIGICTFLLILAVWIYLSINLYRGFWVSS